ncbi:MAG: NUDIX domain-containing protein [Chloroflexaceae bacterium]|nr:NUDIX domain-containing protein [Chloroflexaceae bacterium]
MSLVCSAATKRRALACTLLDRLAAAAPTESGAPGQLVSLEESAGRDYLLGILDALTFLGALRQTADGLGASVVSPQAGWTLRLLNDLLDSGAPLIADWHSPGVTACQPFRRSGDLLAALEARRREVLPQAAPVREVEAAVGVIARAEERDDPRFLLAFDADAGAWQLPGGRRARTDPSIEATLLRELHEELGLQRTRVPDDLTLRPLPPLIAVRDSPTYGVRTRTRFYPFVVTLHQGAPAGEGVRWFGEAELRAGRGSDGRRIDAGPLLYLLERTDLDLAGWGYDRSVPAP